MLNKEDFYKNIFIKIYDEIYMKLKNETTDIFLCGGASFKGNLSIRDKLRNSLLLEKNIRILYPEDLFIDMMNRDKNYDLLSLEKFLAHNSDYIFIVCESAGSLVELGAFTNNEQTVGKVIAIFDEKRRRDKSFIMLGPAKILRKQGNEHIIFYNDPEDLKKKVIKNLRQLNFNNKKFRTHKKPLDNLMGLYHYLIIVLYFYQKLELNDLKKSLIMLYEEKKYNVQDFETLFRPTLKLLYKNKFLVKTNIDGKSIYSLTNKGVNNALKYIHNSNINGRNRLFDSVRFDIMKYDYYSS